jgi:tetratricopeptide (TPR) repeat protein
LTDDVEQRAQLNARASEYLLRAGDAEASLAKLEQATQLDPSAEDLADKLATRYEATEKWEKLGEFLRERGNRLTDPAKRVAARRHAARIFATSLKDKDAARELWLKLLEDGEDREALEKLIDDAIEREDHTEAVLRVRRLGALAVDKGDKTRIALREAELLAEGIGDVDGAVERYESILTDLDPKCRPALQAIADLQEARDNPAAAADALERELTLVSESGERVESGQIAERLARLYELSLDDPRNAIRALDVVRSADPEDFDALARLSDLCEKVELWDRVAELLAERIEVEGDDEEASRMTRKLAAVLADKLSRGDEALAVLTEFADQGDAEVRAAYVELGDRLGWRGIVASKLVDWWFEAKNGPERIAALRGAFERFADLERDQDAIRVALEIVRSKGAEHALAERLEELAVKTSDHDALGAAHDILARELAGSDRARELVRQAEVRARAGLPVEEAIQHGETGLPGVPAEETEPLLERLSALASRPAEVVDLYERQVSRAKTPAQRARALGRAAQVAAAQGEQGRARSLFDLALAGAPTEETLSLLEGAAREGDLSTGSETLRRALVSAMAAGGQGARDGGRTRGSLLRRAAHLAQHDLEDLDHAFGWLGDALVAHVDAETLDAVEKLAQDVRDPRRAEATLTRALSEVFDGPLVRQLVARRATLRREVMDDKAGAAEDLKKLHELSPGDQVVTDELSALLTELSDYRGLAQLYEDQILRGKDTGVRAELARKVAWMWERELGDPREAADAWRRVLRMKQGDAEATAGLERAKASMLKKPASSDLETPPTSEKSAPPTSAVTPVVSHTPSLPGAPEEAHASVHSPGPGTTVEATPPEASPASIEFDPAAESRSDGFPLIASPTPVEKRPSFESAPDVESHAEVTVDVEASAPARRSLPPPLPPPSRASTSAPPPREEEAAPVDPESKDADTASMATAQEVEKPSPPGDHSQAELPEERFAIQAPLQTDSSPSGIAEEDVITVDDIAEDLNEDDTSTPTAHRE